jgi:hypothetical protein
MVYPRHIGTKEYTAMLDCIRGIDGFYTEDRKDVVTVSDLYGLGSIYDRSVEPIKAEVACGEMPVVINDLDYMPIIEMDILFSHLPGVMDVKRDGRAMTVAELRGCGIVVG